MTSIDCRAFQESALQATIFTPDLDHSTGKVMSGFYPQCVDIFDADPEVLPNMPGLPPEVPRIIMRKKDNSLRLEVSAARINFFGGLISGQTQPLDIKKFYSEAVRLFSIFQQTTGCRIARIAAVRTLFIVHENPGLFLARHFCKDTWNQVPLNRPENFELHSHKVYQLNEKFKVNSWARNKTGFLVKDNKRARIVLVEQDMNTVAEELEKRAYDSDEVNSYFDLVIPEFADILCQYYPTNNGD